ncbi:MAG: 6-carboxytetrahydropterin synthase [Tannerella sp.]|jgi:6-pyruvoyltetrahydropterin/6-carboxytetrahydropterin synthase|nr:6-carboxytetrahydropterin synthase [Tannerella sp.]
MYKISKEFHFSASHQLFGLPEAHPCSRLHGHNYVAVFHFQSKELNGTGFVIDYRELEPIKQYIDENLDHRHLNYFFVFNPTAENIAKLLYDIFKLRFPQLYRVEISETPKTKAGYEE